MNFLRDLWLARYRFVAFFLAAVVLALGCGAPGDGAPSVGSLEAVPRIPAVRRPDPGDPIPPPEVPLATCPSYPVGAEAGRLPAPLADTTSSGGQQYTPGSFHVGDDGVAQYTIPIFTPPGRVGMDPDVALQYRSDGPNGVVGVGFRVTGQSAIARCRKDLRDDGVNEAPQYDDDNPVLSERDALCMDGLRLTPVEDGSFRTIPDTHVRVRGHVFKDAPERGFSDFTVETKTGRVLDYGLYSDSRTMGPGGHVRSWELSRVRDRHDNTIEYGYQQATATDAAGWEYTQSTMLARIAYTGHVSGSPAPRYAVLFEYGPRNEDYGRQPYREGLLLEASQILRAIVVKDAQKELRRYTLVYDNAGASGASKLVKLTECAGSDCARPTTFAWAIGQEAPFGLAQDTGIKTEGTTPYTQYMSADFNGDGFGDLFFPALSGDTKPWLVAFGHADPAKPQLPLVGMQQVPFGQGVVVSRLLGDYDLRGGTDIVIPTADTFRLVRFANGAMQTEDTGVASGGGSVDPEQPRPSQWLVDLNGDTAPDLVECRDNTGDFGGHWVYRLHTTEGGFGPLQPIHALDAFNVYVGQNTALPYCQGLEAMAMDVDGDGDGDLLLRGVEFVYQLDGSGIPASHTLQLSLTPAGIVVKDTGHTSYRFGMPADLNGDGLPDLLSHESKSKPSVQTWVNTGRGFQLRPTQAGLNEYMLQRGIVGDLNGDGCDDVILPQWVQAGDPPAPTGKWLWLRADCAFGFHSAVLEEPTTAGVQLPSGSVTRGGNPRLTDLDGDGLPDLIFPVHSPTEAGAPLGPVSYRLARHNKAKLAAGPGNDGPADDALPDTLKSVRDGRGRADGGDAPSVWITYAPLHTRSGAISPTPPDLGPEGDPPGEGPGTDKPPPETYTPGAGCAYPASCVVSSRRVVARAMFATASVIETRSLSFRYEGGVSDRQGRGFLGFRARTVVDEQTHASVRTEREFPFDPTLRRYVTASTPSKVTSSVTATALDGTSHKLITVTNYDPIVVPTNGGATYFVDANTLTAEYQDGVVVRQEQMLHTLDAYGNEVSLTVSQAAGTDWLPPRIVTRENIKNDEASWLLGLVGRVTVTDGPFTQVATYAWDDVTGDELGTTYRPDDEALRLETTRERDAYGNTTRTIARGATGGRRSWCTSWDAEGYVPYARANALGHTTTETHGASGELRSLTDPNQRTTRYAYDGFLRPTREERPDGTFAYDLPLVAPSATSSTTWRSQGASGQRTTLTLYDRLSRPIETYVTRQGGSWSLGGAVRYDVNGRPTRIAQPSPIPMQWPAGMGQQPNLPSVWWGATQYDEAGRVLASTDANGNTWRRAYDALSVTSVDPKGVATQTRVDARARVVEQTVDGTVTSYAWYEHDALKTVTDAHGNVTSYEPDSDGQLVSVTHPDHGTRSFTRNAFSDVTREIDAAGVVTTWTYDVLGRPRRRVDNDGVATWTYDAPNAFGRLAGSRSPDGHERKHTYDALGRPIRDELTVGTTTLVTDMTYDALGRLERMAYPQGPAGLPRFVVGYQYDGSSGAAVDVAQLQQQPDGTEARISLWHREAESVRGQTTAERFGNGVTTRRTYDPGTGALRLIQTAGLRKTETLQNLVYEYDENRNVRSRRDLIQGHTESFTYDGLQRLKEVHLDGSPAPRYAYAYDAIGNLTWTQALGTLTYDAAARPHAVRTVGDETIDYDANGNVSVRGTMFTQETFGYTSLGKVRSRTFAGQITHYEFDADGERVLRVDGSVSTLYGRGYERESRPKLDGLGSTVTHRYYVATGERVIAVVTDGGVGRLGQLARSTTYVHPDALGSTDVLTGTGGTVLERQSFDPFGNRRSVDWASDAPPAAPKTSWHFGFAGSEDEPRSLIDMKARVYDPKIGKFLAPDPLAMGARPGQHLNPYSYVRNNPLTLRDPSGLDPALDSNQAPPEARASVPGIDESNTVWVFGVRKPQYNRTVGPDDGGVAGVFNNPSADPSLNDGSRMDLATFWFCAPGECGGGRAEDGALPWSGAGDRYNPFDGQGDWESLWGTHPSLRTPEPAPEFVAIGRVTLGLTPILGTYATFMDPSATTAEKGLSFAGDALALVSKAAALPVVLVRLNFLRRAVTSLRYARGIPPGTGSKLANSLRIALDIDPRRNVALAEFALDGASGFRAAVSGAVSPGRTVGVPTTRLFATKASGAMTRDLDSEVKLLEHLAQGLDPKSRGVINLFTERPQCGSCAGVISQFREMFPHVTLRVTHGI